MTAVDDSREPGTAPPVFVTGRTRNGGSPPPAGRSIASAWPTARRCSSTERPCGSRSTTEISAANGTSNARGRAPRRLERGRVLGDERDEVAGSDVGAGTFTAT